MNSLRQLRYAIEYSKFVLIHHSALIIPIMYVIIVYDIGVERVSKVCKALRRRLTWVQNSVFEGEISEADYAKIQVDLLKIIERERDSVLCYCINNPKGWEKRVIGQERGSTDTFL